MPKQPPLSARTRPFRSGWAFATTGLALVAMLVPATPAGFASTSTSTLPGNARASHLAHASRTLNVTDTAHLRYVDNSGSLLTEEGSASGTLPGRMRALCNIGPTISASFTIYVHGGSIKGHGTATLHGSGTYESFAGTLVATGGSGRYAHAHGRGGLYGTFNRKTYALVVQTTGRLSY